MRFQAILAVTCLITPALSFPWLHLDGPEAIKRGFEAMKGHLELLKRIRDLHAQQQNELRAWKAAGKRDITASLLNGTIDSIIGPDGGVLAGLNNTYPSNIEGLMRFPEDDHPFQYPGPTDQRGPCPGMNTLANHGYIPRNGIVSAAQTLDAVTRVFNMGADFAAVLIAGGVGLDGDIPTLTYSIGGADARTNSLGLLGGLLGTETGLDGHSRFPEGDASPTRCDFYLCQGDNHNMQPAYFKQMMDLAKQQGGQFNIRAMSQHFHNRYADSRSRNPNFYFVPPPALFVIGVFYLHPGFFSNGTIGAGGSANLASLASFVGAHIMEDGTVVYVPERIPAQGWYRRGVPMFIPEVLAGVLAVYNLSEPVELGANAGSTDNFVPGPGLLPTSAQNVDGLGCVLYNTLYANFFGEFQNILFTVESSLNAVLGLLNPALSNFANCTPNYPAETGPNAYGGALGWLQAAENLPGAPVKQPCLLSGVSGQCIKDTNTYYSGAQNLAGNRYEFTGVVTDGANPSA